MRRTISSSSSRRSNSRPGTRGTRTATITTATGRIVTSTAMGSTNIVTGTGGMIIAREAGGTGIVMTKTAGVADKVMPRRPMPLEWAAKVANHKLIHGDDLQA